MQHNVDRERVGGIGDDSVCVCEYVCVSVCVDKCLCLWVTPPVDSRHTQPDSQGKTRLRRIDGFMSADTKVDTLYKKSRMWERGGRQYSKWPVTSLHSFPLTPFQNVLTDCASNSTHFLHLFIPPFSSSPLMSVGRVSNLAACFTSHTAPVQNSYRPPDGRAAFLLAMLDWRPQQCHSNHFCSLLQAASGSCIGKEIERRYRNQ